MQQECFCCLRQIGASAFSTCCLFGLKKTVKKNCISCYIILGLIGEWKKYINSFGICKSMQKCLLGLSNIRPGGQSWPSKYSNPPTKSMKVCIDFDFFFTVVVKQVFQLILLIDSFIRNQSN